MTQSFADPGTPQGGGGSSRTATVDLTANVSGYTSQMDQAAQSTGMLSKGVDELSSKMAGLNKWAGKKLFHFAAADFSMLSIAAADAATFEKQLSTLAATSAVTGSSLKGISNGIEAAVSKFPVARGEVVQLVETITNLGVTAVSSIGSLTQTFIKLGAATGEPMTQLASGLVQLSRLMGSTDATQIGNYANSLLTVSKNAGVSASGVLQFAQSIAPIARQAHIGEGAVLGISTAFSKAGADGFVATNTFNSMLSDITSSIATGSPELNKFANLIGVTGAQLAKMDKADAMVRILTQIGKQGPQAVAVLNSLGIEGIRAQSAIAAITQSGDLQQQIDTAIGAQGDQGNLNKGSHAAFDNLASSMVNVRNQFTAFGTEIGTTFLTPMTMAANVAANVGRHLNDVVKPFSTLIAGLGVIAGGAAGAGSMALSAAGLIGTYALVRNVKNSKAVSAFRAGTTIGTGREDLAAGSSIDRALKGEAGTIESGAFLLGGGFRNMGTKIGLDPTGARSPWRSGSTWRNALIGGPLGAARMFSGMNERFLRGEMGGVEGERLPMMQRLSLWGRSLQGRSAVDVLANEGKPLARQLGATAQAQAGVGLGMVGRAANLMWRVAGPAVMGTVIGATTGIPAGGRMLNAARGSAATGSIAAESAAGREAAARLRMQVRMLGDGLMPLGRNFSMITRSSADLAIALTRTTSTVLGTGFGAAAGGLGRAVGGAVSATASAGGFLLSKLFSLPGMVAMLGGQALWSHASGDNRAGANMEQYLNPIQSYNDKLGTTTANLANFGQALDSSAMAMKAMASLSIKGASAYGDSDAALAPKKPLNKVWDAVVNAKDPTLLAQSILSSMPIANGGQLRLAERDMTAAGMKTADVNKVIKQYIAAGGPDAVSGLGKPTLLGVQGNAARDSEASGITSGLSQSQTRGAGILGGFAVGAGVGAGIGSAGAGVGALPGALLGGIVGGIGGFFGGGAAAKHFHVNPSQRALMLNANMISGIGSQQVSDVSTRGGAYADQRAFISYASGLGSQVAAGGAGGGYGERQQRAVASALSQITGGGKDAYFKSLKKQDLSEGMSANEQWAAIRKTLGASSKGRNYLGKLDAEGVDLTGPKAAEKNLINLANTNDGSDFNSQLRKMGALGGFSAKSGLIQSAIGVKQGDAGVSYDAVKSLESVAERGRGLSDGFSTAIGRLTQFAARVGDATGAMGKLIAAATQEELGKQANLQPYQSHSQNLLEGAKTYQAVAKQVNIAKATGGVPDIAGMQAAQAAHNQNLASEQAFNVQLIQTANAFHVQMKRADEDYSHSRKLQQDSFQLQSQYSADDYLHNRKLAEDQFRLQSKYAQQDFNLQQLRSNQDHNRALADQAASAAQTIYDPYARIQAKYTISGDQTAQIMEEQNRRIKQQLADIAKLKKQGLSEATIQTLQLADPNNQQQTSNLAQGTSAADIARLNRDAASRQKLTTSLTQSPDNLAFAQQEKAFKTSMTRTATDFATQTARAVKANDINMTESAYQFKVQTARAATQESITLKEMAHQFGLQTSRAAEDLATAATQISGSFMEVKQQAQSAVSVIEKQAPAAAKIWHDAFAVQSVIDLMGLSDPNALVTAGTAAGKAIAAGLQAGMTPSTRDNSTHPASGTPATYNPINIYLPHKAAGGIATKAQHVIFGEAGPEALIPLNQQGQSFMAALLTRALGTALQAYSSRAGGSTSTSVDSSTSFSGPVTVVAQDTTVFEREMKAKARLHKLTSPTRRT